MNQERLTKVLLSLRVSEKTHRINADFNQVTFQVLPNSTKSEIKEAVEQLFSVQVNEVQVVNVKGKVKRFAKRLGKRSDWKKAYVSLEPGHSIDMTGQQ
ncbi:50S ribosomal subunit protein L23 [Gammaproteobacteria bacterium]